MVEIRFSKQVYFGKWLNFSFGERLVSVLSLQDALLDNCDYVSKEARVIDEQIFYFVEDADIKKNDDVLLNKILSEIV